MLNYRKDNEKKGFAKFLDYLHKHIIQVIVVVVLIAGIISTVVIVTGRVADKKSSQKSDITYKEASTIYLPMITPESFDPLSSNDEVIQNINPLIFQSLFDLDENLNIVGELVDSYTTDSKEGSVNIKLKSGISFSDGTNFTADDVAYTVRQIKQIGSKSPYYNYVNRIDYVDVKDNNNLTIYFKSEKDAALDNLVFPIVCSSQYGGSNDFKIGTGPYAYGEYVDGQTLNLGANKYYKGDIAIKNVTMEALDNKNFSMGLMTMDSITCDLIKSSNGDVEAKDKDLKYKKIVSNELEYIGFNCTKPLLSNAKVRKAIALSIDCKSIIEDNYGGSGTVSNSLYYPDFLGVKDKESNEGVGYSKKEAVKLLKSANVKDVDDDGVVETKDGKDVVLKILVNDNNTSRRDTAYSIAEDLKKVGIQSEVVAVSFDDYKKKLESKDFDIYLGGMKIDKQFRLSNMFSSSSYTGFKDAKVISKVDELELALTADEQKKVFGEVKSMLEESMPYYPICYKNYFFVSVDTLKYNKVPTFFEPYRGCNDWTWQLRISKELDETQKPEKKSEKK